MFIPVVAEHDVYNNNGLQQDDINSILELAFRNLFPDNDTTAADEDDDQPDFFHLAKAANYFLLQHFEIDYVFFLDEVMSYNRRYLTNITARPLEVHTPPPDNFLLDHC